MLNVGIPTRLLLAALAVGGGLALSAHAGASTRPNEIIVSAANYAQTPPDVLWKMFREAADLTDVPPPPPGDRPARYYQFLPGETLEADLSYLEVCQLLVPALSAKNLRNTHDQAKVELILRVTFGGRYWRDPFVRKDDLEWRHGLVPKRRGASLSAAQPVPTWSSSSFIRRVFTIRRRNRFSSAKRCAAKAACSGRWPVRSSWTGITR